MIGEHVQLWGESAAPGPYNARLAGVESAGPAERGRSIGDGGKSREPNGFGSSEAAGEGVEELNPASDLASASNAADLFMGTMSRSHWSSSWEGHFGADDFRRKMLFGEER